LLGKDVSASNIMRIKRQYYVGPVLYASAFLISFLSAIASVVLIILTAAFYAVTATIGE
jgi:hypothetical protein